MNAVVPTAAERLADAIATIRPEALPDTVRLRAEELLVDVVGLCVAARHTPYVQALLGSVDGGGP